MRFLYPFDFTEHKLAAMKGFTVDHLILMIDFYKNSGDDLKYLTAIYIDNNTCAPRSNDDVPCRQKLPSCAREVLAEYIIFSRAFVTIT